MDIVDLYKNCYKELYNYVYAITLNIYDTEDIVQYTFFKAFKGLKKFRGDSSIKTWLFKIARNECANYYRKNPKCDDIEGVVVYIERDMEKQLCLKEEIENVIEFILKENEPIRSLLILRLIEERSFKNISDILDKSEVWCRVTFYRMKKKLIDLLENEMI